jgi:hypothetical protein
MAWSMLWASKLVASCPPTPLIEWQAKQPFVTKSFRPLSGFIIGMAKRGPGWPVSVAAFSFDFAVGVVSLAPKLDADAAMATSATIAIPTIPVRIVWCRVPEFIVVSLEIAARPATGCHNYTRNKDR